MRNIQYISASAGSGKTYTLTHKLADAVRGYSLDDKGGKTPCVKVEPEQVILTTYTVKAATEFREKAKAAMHEAGLHDEAERLDQAMIGTVHSVADGFIHKYWYRLGISPELNVMTDEDKDFFINQSLASLPSGDELRFLSQFSYQFAVGYKYGSGKYDVNDKHWQEDLKSIVDYTTNYGITDYTHSEEYSENVIKNFCREGAHVNFDRTTAGKVLDELGSINRTESESGASSKRKNNIEEFGRKLKFINYADMVRLRDFIYGLPKKSCCPAALDFASTLDNIWVSEEVRDMQLRYIRLLFKYAKKWRTVFVDYKRTKHLIDYNDMEALFLDLLGMPDVAADIREEYKYLFVDEFQDSSPIQVHIFDRLSEIVDHSVWVGDYKQAIYGFRGADTDLVKAVTDIIAKGDNGCTTDTLGTSHRSYPEIVETCNKVFIPAFSGILQLEQVELKPYKKNKENLRNLRVWPLEGRSKDERMGHLAYNIACEIKGGKQPKDIAVLALANADLDSLADKLRPYGIPICRDDANVATRDETLLLTALLSLLVNPNDELSRAQIALLTVQGYGTARILDEKLVVNASDGKTKRYLDDIPLVRELLSKLNTFRLQSVRAVVESIIIELDLDNVVAHWENPQQSRSTLQALAETAAVYEDHCLQMTLPATVSGFIAYVSQNGVIALGAPDGIRLSTYHSAKGLEWDTVILLSLDDNPADINKLTTRYYYGVQVFHETMPSASNLYPDMTISLLPWIYGSQKSAPEEVAEQLIDSERFKSIRTQRLSESKRLLYVGMTRPSKELILAPSTSSNGLRIFDTIYDGTSLKTGNYTKSGLCDPLGIGVNFLSETPCDNVLENGDWNYQTVTNKILRLHGEPCNEPPRDIQPSGTESSEMEIEKELDSDGRLLTITGHPDMAGIGSCIHDIFCALDRNKNEDYVKNIIDGYGLSDHLTDPLQVIKAWNRLEQYLTGHFGKSIRRYHELPFKQLVDGQIVTGNMDLVWKTDKGCVLIDYKTFPGNEQLVLSPGDHYAGNYNGQFDYYTNALKAAGENVIARFVYYPVTGMLVKI
ncbi:hypothetical protein LPYR103PRE_13510 [Segatella asaccharophila]